MANQMNVKQVFYSVTAQELCNSRGGRPGLPAPNSPYCLCGRKATLNYIYDRAQELCESRSSRPGIPVRNSPYSLCGRKAILIWNFYSLASVAELEVFLKYFR